MAERCVKYMASVTQRIAQIKQPRGGYIKLSEFDMTDLGGGIVPLEGENVHSTVIGMAVDYLTRFASGASIEDAFKISILGARTAEMMCGVSGAMSQLDVILSKIRGVDSASIVNACKAVTYDVWYRNPLAASWSKGADETNPDAETIRHISLMVKRGVLFFEMYGPVVRDGFTFDDCGFTNTVDAGDGDFLTKDTMWDFKVSKTKPQSKHTLQLLMYWIMGQHSIDPVFHDIEHIGIFNPRMNIVWRLCMDNVSKDIISAVEKDVICYE